MGLQDTYHVAYNEGWKDAERNSAELLKQSTHREEVARRSERERARELAAAKATLDRVKELADSDLLITPSELQAVLKEE